MAKKDIEARFEEHRSFILEKMENIEDYGYLSVYCLPKNLENKISLDHIQNVLNGEKRFSEGLFYSKAPIRFQDGASRGYHPKAINQNIKSSYRITAYEDGLTTLDSQIDFLFYEKPELNPVGVSYEIQRILQLAEAVIHRNASEIEFQVELNYIKGWVIVAHDYRSRIYEFQGRSKPIQRNILVRDIHSNHENWNKVMPVVKDIMNEIANIFGMRTMLVKCWDENEELEYAKFSPSTR